MTKLPPIKKRKKHNPDNTNWKKQKGREKEGQGKKKEKKPTDKITRNGPLKKEKNLNKRKKIGHEGHKHISTGG